jgi:hypothetical protein
MPTGMVIGSATGVISGWTPDAVGTVNVTVTVTDGTDPVSSAFTIAVAAVPIPPPVDLTVESIKVEDEYKEGAYTYVKGGERDVTVTFSRAIVKPGIEEPLPTVEVGGVTVPLNSADKKVWKGTGDFTGPCKDVLIEVGGVCDDICASTTVTVDSVAPVISLEAEVKECDCDEGYQLIITSTGPYPECGTQTDCCGDDDCSGLKSVLVEIYTVDNDVTFPWELCCDLEDCAELIGSDDSCAIEAKTECIPAVYTQSDEWVDFFDGIYYVKAVLEDNAGNVNTYYGEVITTDKDTVSFRELFVDPVTCAWCYTEALEDVDEIIGNCEAPLTECWEPELDPCPEVTLDPEVPMVGEEVTITIDYSDAVKPGIVSAYVGPAIKLLPFGIPEDARELVLSGPVDDVYTATYIFGQAGTDYIYVINDCEGCEACKYAVTVEPIPELGCPDVSFLPTSPLVGQETLITFTFDRAPRDDEEVRAWVGPAIKGFPEGIPEDAAPLVLVQGAAPLDNIFTAVYTFGSAGTDFIYTIVNCGEDCTPCTDAITVRPIEDCPEFAWTDITDANSELIGKVTWLRGGDTYTFTLTYDHEITSDEQKLYQVRIRDYYELDNLGNLFDDFRLLADMTTTNNMVFTGTFTPPTYTAYPNGDYVTGEYCTEAYVEVDILEDCCEPCMFKFAVDATLPTAEIEITAVDNCGLAFLEFDSVEITCDDTCCVDTCTWVASWTIDIFDTIPIWDCCELETEPMDYCQFAGDYCPIDVEQDEPCENCCLDTGDYWIITTLTDAVGNVNSYYVELTLLGTTGNWIIEEDASVWICDPIYDGSDATNPWDDGTGIPTDDDGKYGEPCE